MRKRIIGIFCMLAMACLAAGLPAAAKGHKVTKLTVTGKLERVVGPGGETTGWAIQLDSPLKIGKETVRSIEVNHQTNQFEPLANKHVEASGQITHHHGVTRGDWPVLAVASIRESKSPQ